MNILCMDTSHRFLAVGVLKDGVKIAGIQEECWKKQSEQIFPVLEEVMKEAGITPDDIDGAVISSGPGSYTGVRIAMTVAKVFCSLRDIPLYTLETLRLYAGARRHCRVVLDARGGRAYTAVFDRGEVTESASAAECSAIDITDDETVIGDGGLVGRETVWPDIVQNFADLEAFWKKAENVHLVVPDYMKSSDAYLVKK